MMPKMLMAVLLLAATPAWAQSESFCRGDARNVERDLMLRGDQISPQDRIIMERRLSTSTDLCNRDPSRASADLDNLRRDLILQAERPQTDLDTRVRPPAFPE